MKLWPDMRAKRATLLFPGIFTFLTLADKALAQGRESGGWHMGPGMMGWGYGLGWLGTVLMVAFWIAIIVGMVFLIRWLVISIGAGPQKAGSADTPLDILKKRYARGEIDREEFLEKKRDLGY